MVSRQTKKKLLLSICLLKSSSSVDLVDCAQEKEPTKICRADQRKGESLHLISVLLTLYLQMGLPKSLPLMPPRAKLQTKLPAIPPTKPPAQAPAQAPAKAPAKVPWTHMPRANLPSANHPSCQRLTHMFQWRVVKLQVHHSKAS